MFISIHMTHNLYTNYMINLRMCSASVGQVEQLHKIFKLCGSPSEDYWKKCKLPHATTFKPQHPYPSTLQEKFKDYPSNFVNLMETLLSIDPYKRGTASSAIVADVYLSPFVLTIWFIKHMTLTAVELMTFLNATLEIFFYYRRTSCF